MPHRFVSLPFSVSSLVQLGRQDGRATRAVVSNGAVTHEIGASHRPAFDMRFAPLALLVLAACEAAPPVRPPDAGAPDTGPPVTQPCDWVEGAIGTVVTVEGPFATDVVTPLAASAVGCTPGTCCNQSFWGATVACDDGSRVYLAPPASVSPTSTRLDYVCVGASDSGRPSAACPVGPSCVDQIARLGSVTGTVARRTFLAGGEVVAIEVSSVRLLDAPDAGPPPDAPR